MARSRAWLVTVMSVALVAISAMSAAGQSFNGAVTGVVRDSSGGGGAGDRAHAAQRRDRSDGGDHHIPVTDGEYAFRNLAPAKYEVTAVKTGFQQVVSSPTSSCH